MRALLIALLLGVLAFAQPASAQAIDSASNEPAAPRSVTPSAVDVLLTVHAVAHAADMITTAYDLSLSPDAREANPMLGAFSRQPVRLTILSGVIDILQTYTISKLQHRHPKIARVWVAALVGVEVWATVNNINAAGELQHRAAR